MKLVRLGWDSFQKRLAIVSVAIIIAATALMIGYFSWSQRSFAVIAQTHSAVLVVTGKTISSWWLRKAILCVSQGRENENGVQAEICGSKELEIKLNKSAIVWPVGTRLEIEKVNGTAPLIIKLKKLGATKPILGEVELTQNSRIVIDPPDWQETGVFPFSGVIYIGDEPSAGKTGYLLNGRFEIHESLLFRNSSVLVKEGSLFPGDRVTLQSTDAKEISVNGFLSAQVDGDRDPGLQVVAFSPLGETQMRIDRIATSTSIIKSTWLDRAVNDPWLLGIAGVLATMLTMIEFLSKLTSWILRRHDRADGPTNASADATAMASAEEDI